MINMLQEEVWIILLDHNYIVTFPAGQTNATFDVPINDDNNNYIERQ